MSTRRVAEQRIELPENPTYLEFQRTDGNANNWPSNTTRIVDHEGEVNFMQYQDLSSPPAMRWRLQVAKAISIELGMADGSNYILKDWPQGYRMYDHHKGREMDPRHDIYLFGPKGFRFRSINEFIPHAIWLMRDHATDTTPCRCKYCSKRSQKEITASMSNILARATTGTMSPTPSQTSKPPRDRNAKMRSLLAKSNERKPEQKVYAAVQKAVKPFKMMKPSSNVIKQPLLVERHADLRAVHSRTSMALKRWFREGEMVWCALNPPIIGSGDVTISFWPGLIEQGILKTIPIPRPDDSSSDPQSSTTNLGHPVDSVNSQSDTPAGTVLDNSDAPPLPWIVRQSTMYKVQLLAVAQSYTVPDDQVLPYQAHIPPTDLIELLQAFAAERLDFDHATLKQFNPLPREKAPNFDDAVAPYAVAIQIGSRLSRFYSLTDEWEFKYTNPAANTVSTRPSTSLQSAIEAAGRHNAQTSMLMSANGQAHQNVTGPSSVLASEMQNPASQVMGAPRIPGQLVQTRFQGLWWGAERIWGDDFVRLKVARRALAPKGADHILPPSGPGKSALDYFKASRFTKDEDLGAGSRGVFMRLDGLYLADASRVDGRIKKECRASGMLYELADEDWEETDKQQASASRTNGVTSSSLSHQNGNSEAGPSTFSALSSKLTSLPNPDPSVPISETTQSVLSQVISPIQRPSTPAVTAPTSPYLLPDAPIGYRFRPILEPGYEAVVNLGLVSGRYYPRVLDHPLLKQALDRAISVPAENGGVNESNNLWALEGLAPGYHNCVDANDYKKSRVKMLDEAEKGALSDLEEWKQAQMVAAAMVVDEAEDEAVDRKMKEMDLEVDQLAYPMDVDG
ncbi:hypothetical protein BDQ12DRAFT_628755 [Crucibulum laeve]|uniref:Cryptic loci regulator 2 N-terminal domain-containing protein n=1 Tax=Crucibulum laeve TaxID=68775 RepID=A0A5C3M3N6_9AGAR|nr:hypothetical protein BDQ12DRAFT_628755 [Crucibulum laeve]